jgi:NDP-sugar pyrophosphorylase family protein
MIIIPMAGKSSRFFKAGYDIPKYMLPLNGSNVFKEAVGSFKNYFEHDFFLFITRRDYGVEDFVKKECISLGINNFEVVTLDEDTRGQADTVKIGLDKLKIKNDEDEMYVFNIDSIRVNFKKPNAPFFKNTSGYLEVFEDEGEHWSFVEPLKNNYVKRTTEKIRISNLCSNGLYYFLSVGLFKQIFIEFEKNNDYKELFIAPMYNFLIKKNLGVKYLLLEQNQTLFAGTPTEYEQLKENIFKTKTT